MEGLDSTWPNWLIVIGLILNFLRTPLSKTFPAFFGILTKTSEAKLKAAEYERMRESFHEDKTFELLEDTLKFLREDRKASREDAKAQLKQNQEMFKGISRQAASIDQLAALVRILSQNSANHDDKLGGISQSVARTDDRVSRIEQRIDKAVRVRMGETRIRPEFPVVYDDPTE